MNNEEIEIASKDFFNYYKKEIGKALKARERAIKVSFKELLNFNSELAEEILDNPEATVALMEETLEDSGLVGVKKFRLRFVDVPELEGVSLKIRNLRSKHLGKFVLIEGIIRQASSVLPQVTEAKFECPVCGTKISIIQLDSRLREPSRCTVCGRRAGFKLIKKEMVDTQRLVLEEAPESLSGGEQPRRLNVFLKEDLVEPKIEEKTTPGSKLRVMGTLKEIPLILKSGKTSTRFDIALEANNLIPLEETFYEIEISEEDERQIKELALDPEVYQKLARSIAPSIYGYDEVKEAIVLQLLSGVKKQKSDGTFSRGDMHILLVGDPGVAKSHILNFVSRIAPRGRYVVGKAATGAGLTATVVRDEYLRGWSLEAGAMVLANKGIACIDELDKMREEDSSAMHEALEQQTVTITKANVQATLRAETSVIAAANPKLGRFDPYKLIAEQINLPPTLINRFDLIFIMRDLPQKEKDELIALHVLKDHKEPTSKSVIDPELFRKFIAYAKQHIKPKLSDKAIQVIKKFYVDLRNQPTFTSSEIKPIPISPRQLEALIRLSEASAKVHLSKTVKEEDAQRAINILKFSLSQVGFDEETQTFDIDKIATGISTSERSKIITVRETISQLENRFGKLIPFSEVVKELEGKVPMDKIEEAIDKLRRFGELFEPRKGYIQRIGS